MIVPELGLRQSATARASCGLERLLARVEGLEGGEMSKGDWQGNLTGAAKILEKVALPAKRAASETTCAKLAGRMIEFGAQCETVGADASLSAVGRREKWGRLLSDARSTVLEYEALATGRGRYDHGDQAEGHS